jgi:hypothetical protein
MTASNSGSIAQFNYSARTIQRADRALCCSPFRRELFLVMQHQSVPLSEIEGPSGMRLGYCKRSLPELWVENQLLWLIQVGVLRREVDGQGITDSFRLTPLGRWMIDKYSDDGKFPQASLWDRIYNAWQYWARLPV